MQILSSCTLCLCELSVTMPLPLMLNCPLSSCYCLCQMSVVKPLLLLLKYPLSSCYCLCQMSVVKPLLLLLKYPLSSCYCFCWNIRCPAVTAFVEMSVVKPLLLVLKYPLSSRYCFCWNVRCQAVTANVEMSVRRCSSYQNLISVEIFAGRCSNCWMYTQGRWACCLAWSRSGKHRESIVNVRTRRTAVCDGL